jgi:glycosyltransferase involved in cell wall biosynthesis
MLLQRAARLVRERRMPDVRFWWSRRQQLWRELARSRMGAWHAVHTDPPIIYIMPFGREVEALAKRLRGRRVWLLISNPWIPRGAKETSELRLLTENLLKRYPRLSVTYLCNDQEEAERLANSGMAAEFCHQNAFIDEHSFRVLPTATKSVDAIYIAQLTAYKRHYLAREVQDLVVKTYLTEWCDREYIQGAIDALKHARWVYDLGQEQLCRLINDCRVGLCLSAVEGGMYASMEYLLCGLPIVTTPNVGGRDVFFDSEHVMTVDADPTSVARGVQEVINRHLDPHRIRASALEKVETHRTNFVNIVNRILVTAGRKPSFRWGDRFTHKMYKTQAFSDLRRELRSES